MSLPETIQHMYQELAIRYERQNELRLRDVFFLLAADVAHASGRADDAERLHRMMLEANPNSLLRPFASFAVAVQSLDIQDYLADLRRQFPPEDAERLLLKVRANPLGSAGQRVLGQRDTQEVNPPTARTVNMPPPSNLPPRKKSPYEQTAPPPPATTDDSPWTASLTMFWLFLLMLAGLGLAIWTLARPLWDPA